MDRQTTLSSEEDSNHQSKFNVPSVNLANPFRKEVKNSARPNLGLATKKISQGKKTVRFPDSAQSGVLHAAPSVLSAKDLELDTEMYQAPSGPGLRLPSFQITVPIEPQLDSESESVYMPITPVGEPVNVFNEDSSGDEGSYYPSQRDSQLAGRQDEVDLSELRSSSIPQSRKSNENNKEKGFKSIFRKMSLIDHGQSSDMPSRSDTFLGKVLNFGGRGSGGLVPGASTTGDEAFDEEKEIGAATDNAIEMKQLDFADLSEEAHNLISAHVPGTHTHKPKEKLVDSDLDAFNSSSKFFYPDEKLASATDDRDKHARTNTETSGETFFQPNPDYLIEDSSDQDKREDFFDDDSFVAPPKKVHAGVLSSLLKLYQNNGENRSTATLGSSNGASLANESAFSSDPYTKPATINDFALLKATIKAGGNKLTGVLKGKDHNAGKYNADQSNVDDEGELGELVGDAAKLPSFQNAKPIAPKTENRKIGKRFKKRENQKLCITVHIADILQRQRFIIRLCKALMMYGAPTHRLEEYMVMTSRVLEIDGQFVYFPGTMIVAFGDVATRTSEVHLVKCSQGLNLSKLVHTHKIYKEVVHDLSGVEDATAKLEELIRKRNIYLPWACVLLFGLGSATVCAWGFGGGWLDIPVTFALGLFVGYLQFFLSPKSYLYSSVFEVAASIVVSFISRAVGSIKGGNIFCFSAIAQGALALILPGYIILCGSLELQSKNLVAGSVRMFYAIVYSLFLGFGITLGAALYGWVDSNATNLAVCVASHGLDPKWRILFVPMFSVCLSLINQAQLIQLPVMTLITAVSYVATYFASLHFTEVTEFTAAIGAFIIGVLGNIYSRLGRGIAVSAMLPAIFVQVPGGIASKGSLLAGVTTANKITNSSSEAKTDVSSLSFGATMVEVSIGISVGLCAAALVIYPFGKQRSSLFTL